MDTTLLEIATLLGMSALLEMGAPLGRGWKVEGRPRWNRRSETYSGTRRACSIPVTPPATTRSLSMRSLLTLLVAPFLVVAVVVCVLLLEPVRWCVVRTRPWRRRTAVVRRVAIGPRQTLLS
jgi:hypothetical protein